MMNGGYIWIVSKKNDQLSNYIIERLRDLNTPFLQTDPRRVSDLNLSLIDEKFYIERKLIKGIFLRAGPDSFYNNSFINQDSAFCNSEIGALLLAAVNLESILAINKCDAQLWFDKSTWTVWRNRFLQNDIKVANFKFGESEFEKSTYWLPYNGTVIRESPEYEIRRELGAAVTDVPPSFKFLQIGKEILGNHCNVDVKDLTDFIINQGTFVSELLTDSEGNIISINTLPVIKSKNTLIKVSNLIAKEFYDFMLNR